VSTALDNPARAAEIGLYVLLAVADGDVSEREIAALSSRVGAILGDDFPAMALGILVDTELGKMSELGPDRYIASLVDRLPVERRLPALRGALIVASADGLAPEEERMFSDVAVELGIDPGVAAAILDDVRRTLR
jgi:tellurite resistance protein